VEEPPPAALSLWFRSCTEWEPDGQKKGGSGVSILWIILIVILVLALLGFFTRGYW
jgi:flagellar basal body-associated protein FliL